MRGSCKTNVLLDPRSWPGGSLRGCGLRSNVAGALPEQGGGIYKGGWLKPSNHFIVEYTRKLALPAKNIGWLELTASGGDGKDRRLCERQSYALLPCIPPGASRFGQRVAQKAHLTRSYSVFRTDVTHRGSCGRFFRDLRHARLGARSLDEAVSDDCRCCRVAARHFGA